MRRGTQGYGEVRRGTQRYGEACRETWEVQGEVWSVVGRYGEVSCSVRKAQDWLGTGCTAYLAQAQGSLSGWVVLR